MMASNRAPIFVTLPTEILQAIACQVSCQEARAHMLAKD